MICFGTGADALSKQGGFTPSPCGNGLADTDGAPDERKGLIPEPFAMWKATLLTGIWTLAVAYAVWFGAGVWTDPGVMLYLGHTVSLIFWGVPLVPLVLLSWWLLRRWTALRQRMPPLFLAGWVALILIPMPPSPMSHTVPGQPTTTTVSPLFWVVMVVVSVGPVILTAAMWVATFRARRAVGRPAA